MLVLSRRVNQTICIGNDIKVMVIGLDRGQVRLGIQAPIHIAVDREEIKEAKERGREADALMAAEIERQERDK